MLPSTVKGPATGKPPSTRMLPAESRAKGLPRIVPYGSPLRASTKTSPNSPFPRTIVLTPGASSTTLLRLRAKLRVEVQVNPLSDWTGVTVSRASIPRLLISPALIHFEVKPVVGGTWTLKIWLRVDLSYQLASSVTRFVNTDSSTPTSSERVISGFKSALARAGSSENCG